VLFIVADTDADADAEEEEEEVTSIYT